MPKTSRRISAFGKYALLAARKQYASVENDYDNVADTYDDFYAFGLGRAAERFVGDVSTQLPHATSAAQYLELAAGTGQVTRRLVELASVAGGTLTAVDQSAKMLQANSAKNQTPTSGGNATRFVHADAIEHLRRLPPASVDGVFCAWGICYLDHGDLQRELGRILKPGGYIGIIENRKGTLHELDRMFTYVLMDNPSFMRRAISINLPKDAAYIQRHVLPPTAGTRTAVDDVVSHIFDTPAGLVDYIVKSGVAAGYLDAIEESARPDFIVLLEKEAARRGVTNLPVTHRYSIVTAVV